MALAFAPFGQSFKVTRINAEEKVIRHLNNLGLVVGAEITPVFDNGGDVILKIKDCRVALNKALAMRIMVA